jgi:hypothetical protein
MNPTILLPAVLGAALASSAQSVSGGPGGFANPMTQPDQLVGSASNSGGTAAAETLPNCATGLTYAISPTSAFGCIAGPTVLSSQFSTTDQLAAATGISQQPFATTYTLPANLFIASRVIRLTFVFGLTTSSSPATTRFRLYVGGATGRVIYDSTAFAPSASLNGRSAIFTCTITGTAAAGASEPIITGCLGVGNPVTAWTIANTVAPNQSIATNTAEAITATMTYGATTSGNTSNLWSMLVEQLN